MPKTIERSLVVAFVALLVAGCSPGRSQNKCIPTKGVLLVDGQPLAGVRVTAYALEPDPRQPAIPEGITDAKGEFRLSTYAPADGCPEGEYQFGFIRVGDDETDVWRMQYQKPPGGSKRYTVSGPSVDLGTLELKTK